MDVLTIRQTVKRAREEGLGISEYSLRNWIKKGVIPVQKAGNKVLIYYPNITTFIRAENK